MLEGVYCEGDLKSISSSIVVSHSMNVITSHMVFHDTGTFSNNLKSDTINYETFGRHALANVKDEHFPS